MYHLVASDDVEPVRETSYHFYGVPAAIRSEVAKGLLRRPRMTTMLLVPVLQRRRPCFWPLWHYFGCVGRRRCRRSSSKATCTTSVDSENQEEDEIDREIKAIGVRETLSSSAVNSNRSGSGAVERGKVGTEAALPKHRRIRIDRYAYCHSCF